VQLPRTTVHETVNNQQRKYKGCERVLPTGTNRPLALELPKVECADDAQVALTMVIDAFGRGEITVREFSPMLGSVDRMARVAERIQQNRERERERYGARWVHGLHPDMIPKAPPGWTDPLETVAAAIERGEDPFPDDPVRSAYVVTGERLYSPVNSGGEATGSTSAAAQETEASASAADGLYFPVNSEEGSSDEDSAAPARADKSPGETLALSLPRAEADERRPEAAEAEGNPEAAATLDDSEREVLYSPVNSGARGEAPLHINPG
jgi:hypothetical protein